MKSLSIFIVGFLSIYASSASAAVERLQAGIDKKGRYIENGAFVGGEAGTAHSLLGVRRFYSKPDGVERVILDLGDQMGEPLRGRVSYFQANLDAENKRILVDLSQMSRTAINQEGLNKSFENSAYIKSSKLTYDPVDGSMTLELKLKNAVKMEAFKLPSAEKASRIVLDLTMLTSKAENIDKQVGSMPNKKTKKIKK